MSEKLSADLNIIQSAPIELELLDGDLNIIQKLDDEPNDVGGLTSAELKAKFDESGNIIKKYINETLIPAVLAEDATEESRKQAEAARVAAEQVRQSNEAARQNAEAQRVSAENARNVWEDYSSSKAYAVGNKVASAGSSYLCIKPCTGIAPPNAEYWRLIAAKGAKGDTGAQGAQGPQGPQGAIGPEGPVGGFSNFVRYDAAQTLTDAQKMQARTNINAAPGGFGLGDFQGVALESSVEGGLNTAVKCGWYYFGGDGSIANAPSLPDGGYGALLVSSRASNSIVIQICFLETVSTIAIRRRVGSEWQPWEYLNPPMQLGVEYRTTERYKGRPVYIKAVDTGALPNATYKSVTISFPNANAIVDYGGEAYQDMDHFIPLPCLKYGVERYDTEKAVQVTVDNTYKITIATKDDLSSFTSSSVWVKYTKSTD